MSSYAQKIIFAPTSPLEHFLSMRWLELDKYIPTFNILKIEPLCWWLRAFWRAFKSWFCWSLRQPPEGFLICTLIIGLFYTKVNKILKFGCARATARANRSMGSKCSYITHCCSFWLFGDWSGSLLTQLRIICEAQLQILDLG